MTKLSILAASLLCCTSMSAVAFDDTNPFLENHKQVRDVKTEPNGVSIYAFEDSPNRVTEISPDKAYLQEVKHTKAFGYAHVAEARVTDFKVLTEGFRQQKAENARRIARIQSSRMSGAASADIEQAAQNMLNTFSFEAVDLTQALRGESQTVLVSPGGNYIPKQGWDSMTRIIDNSELGRVVISEWYYVASKGGVIMDENAVNHYINGNPAVLIVRESKSGRAETVLAWADDQKSYTIQVDTNVSKKGMTEYLTSFAESISQPFIHMKAIDVTSQTN